MTTATVQTSGLREVPTEAVAVREGFNPRRVFDLTAANELAESVRQRGILQPLLVREVAGGGLELVAGERRLRAALAVGLATVPVVVRSLTDLEALELAVMENLQRVDVNAIEEAEGFTRLIQGGVYSPDELAAKLGKSRAHVYARLRLLKLAPEIRAAVERGDLEATTAELFAKVPDHAGQRRAWRSLGFSASGGGESFRNVKAWFETRWPSLKGVPWVSDETLVASVPACSACPKCSLNMPDLAGLGGKAGVCTDDGCFADKQKAYGRARLAEAKAAGREVVEISDWYGSEPAQASGYQLVSYRPRSVFAKWDGDCPTWGAALKKTGYVPAVVVTPAGECVEVVKVSEARAALIAAGELKATARGGREAAPVERKAAREAGKRDRYGWENVAASVNEKLVTFDAAEVVAFLVSTYAPRLSVVCDKLTEPVPALGKLRGVAVTGASVFPLLAAAKLKPGVLAQAVFQAASSDAKGAWNRYDLERVGAVLGLDVRALHKSGVKAGASRAAKVASESASDGKPSSSKRSPARQRLAGGPATLGTVPTSGNSQDGTAGTWTVGESVGASSSSPKKGTKTGRKAGSAGGRNARGAK